MRFAIAVNRKYTGKLTNASPAAWNEFNRSFRNDYLTIEEIANAIRAGYAITSHHRGIRKAANFIRGQHVGLDFDTEDERSTFEQIMSDPFIRENAAIIHTTPSHRPEAPRARVIFVLDRAIPAAKRESYSLLYEALIDYCGTADAKCKDPCRLFFGSPDCEMSVLGHVLTLERAAEIVIPYKERKRRDEERRREEAERIRRERAERCLQASENVVERYVNNALDSIFDKLATTPVGERHNTLLACAMACGALLKASWVPEGLISEERIMHLLEAACQANGHYQENPRNIKQTILDGIRFAEPREEPIWRVESNLSPSTILPEILLTPEQATREQEAIERMRQEGYWQGFHDGLTVGQRIAWQQAGIPDSAIDRWMLGFAEDREALAVPYFHNGEPINIEYRSIINGSISYESDRPVLFEAYDNGGQILILDDSLSAIRTIAYSEMRMPQLQGYAIWGLPALRLRQDSFDTIGDRTAIAVVGPQISDERADEIRKYVRVARVPFALDQMIDAGLEHSTLRWYLRQAA